MNKQTSKRRSSSRRKREHTELLERALARPRRSRGDKRLRQLAGEGSGFEQLQSSDEKSRANYHNKFIELPITGADLEIPRCRFGVRF